MNQSESEVAQSCPTLCNPMDCSPLGFSRQEYWSGLPSPSPKCGFPSLLQFELEFCNKELMIGATVSSAVDLLESHKGNRGCLAL